MRAKLIGPACLAAVIGAFAVSAPAGYACGANHACGYANANYSPGAEGYYWDPYALPTPQFLGWFATPSCPGGNWNDCISSLVNNGRFTECYSMNWSNGPSGPVYTNAAYTAASYVGGYWNDTFSGWYYTWTGHC